MPGEDFGALRFAISPYLANSVRIMKRRSNEEFVYWIPAFAGMARGGAERGVLRKISVQYASLLHPTWLTYTVWIIKCSFKEEFIYWIPAFAGMTQRLTKNEET